MSYRQFCFFTDDGEVDLGPKVSLPAYIKPFPDASGLYGVEGVESAMNLLAKRCFLSKLLPDI